MKAYNREPGEAAGTESAETQFSSVFRPTWAEIDLDALVHNFRTMQLAVGRDVAVLTAIKAEAYGHGTVPCAGALQRAGASWFGVALPEEGQTLRRAGITGNILCLGGFWYGQEELILSERLTPVVFSVKQLERLNSSAKQSGIMLEYHLKVDTGMCRLGVPDRDLGSFLDVIASLNHVRMSGLMTHMASADEPSQAEFTARQVERFDHAIAAIRTRGHSPECIHMANSAAASAYPGSRRNLVRLGGAIYGLWRDTTSKLAPPRDLRPVMSLKTRILHLKTVPPGTPIGYGCSFVTTRTCQIATLPIGYCDGLPRSLSNLGKVLAGGAAAPIVGRISMDLTTVDVSEIAGAGVGDEVVVFGRQGGLTITAEEVAGQIGTIGYEITCGVGPRVPRVYRP